MDLTNDILLARLVFGTGLGPNDGPFTSRNVRLDDAEKLVQHAAVVERALMSELDLHKTPKLVEATVR